MTDTAPDLLAFLRARLDEDEAVARAATAGPWRWDKAYYTPGGDESDTGLALTNGERAEVVGAYNWHCCSYRDDPLVADPDAAHIARHDPARALREVAAKRAVLDWYGVTEERQMPPEAWVVVGEAVRLLASVYADHPDYRAEWVPTL